MFIDNDIIAYIKNGDRKAMHRLYNLTARYLFAVCQRYVVNDDDVKDVLQETYVRVFRNMKDFNPKDENSLLSWMTRIAVNESLMLLRRKQRNSFIVSVDDIPDCEDEPEISRFNDSELHNAIMLLPTGYRTVLNLFCFEGMSHKQIADILGIKESSSASQLNRAKRLLREILLKQEGGTR